MAAVVEEPPAASRAAGGAAACGGEAAELLGGLVAQGPGAAVPGPGKIKGIVVNEEPLMLHFTDFVSREEVAHILELCEGRWERSMVSAGKASELHGAQSADATRSGAYGEDIAGDSRTSTSVHLTFDESFVVERIAARVATVCGSTLGHVEPLVAVRYEPGQYFRVHHDGAMRSSTVFVYLNGREDGVEGGQTLFPGLGLEVQPSARTALMWHNRTDDGAADQRLRHEAKPVDSGVKYGMNCFVNIRPHRDTSNIVLVPLRGAEHTEGQGAS